MNSDRKQHPQLQPTVDNLSQAIFTVNRHAKTATNPKFLYKLKQVALQKMLKKGLAEKVGLHFSANPKYSQQQSDVLVKCGDYTFHLPPSKQDFDNLPHLGKLDQTIRNPRSSVSLNAAKQLLIAYTGLSEPNRASQPQKKEYTKPVFKKLGQSYF
ncbi:YkyB family protein [Cytobacillus gottheilii]|uniref:YkyB family protein n=1 Tax=Cytobacillus gottheilii TaxID=859144 RepID=UPI0009B9C965|nr:YkyB family protein [Cytobacillus gottheilii]